LISGAGPNAPRDNVFRITVEFGKAQPDFIVSFGGGSTIDAAKRAGVLHGLARELDDYFGTELVSAELEKTGKILLPHMAIQTAASSAAHLTKYSNITILATGQMKLIQPIQNQITFFSFLQTLGLLTYDNF